MTRTAAHSRSESSPVELTDSPGGSADGGPVRLGRRRDHSRDAQILDAALEVLAEVGYAGMTVDMVAARARAGKATVYRRWSSKEEVVVEALSRLRGRAAPLDQLPDTGSLRGDLLALFRPQASDEAAHTMKIMSGLMSMVGAHAGLDDVVDDVVIAPWADAHRVLMQRAVDRGEIPGGATIDTVCQLVATVAAYRTLIQRQPFDRDFLVRWVDDVVLPALHAPPRAVPADASG